MAIIQKKTERWFGVHCAGLPRIQDRITRANKYVLLLIPGIQVPPALG